MREAKAWQKARMPKDKGERSGTFEKIAVECHFASASLSSFGTICKGDAGWSNRLGAHESQKTAERAFSTADNFGYGGETPLQGRQPAVALHRNREVVSGGKSALPVSNGTASLFSPCPPRKIKKITRLRPWVTSPKCCRIARRNASARRRWHVQLIQEALAPVSHDLASGKEVCLDIGPSTVAVLSEQTAELAAFCPTVTEPRRVIRKIQRTLNRCKKLGKIWHKRDRVWLRNASAVMASWATRSIPMAAQSFHINRFKRISAAV
jgi:hypothetical protein